MNFIKYILLISVLLISFGCNESMQRTNPFDPDITMKTFLEEGYQVLEVDNVMTREDSPYYIDKNLTIKAELRIEPGVEIKISPGVAIDIDGSIPKSTIIAIGTQDNLIRFTPAGNQNWYGILVNHLQNTNTIFQYCRFEYANNALEFSDDTLNVVNCQFDEANIYMSGYGYGYNYGDGANGPEPIHPLIKNCTFMNSTIGITYGAEPWILYNSFSGGSHAIYADHNSKPKIGYNKFGEDLPLQGAGSFINSSPHLYQNTITNALDSGFRFLGGNTAMVEFNEFSQNEVNIYIRTTNDPGISITPLNNDLTIENNNFGTANAYNVSLRIIGAGGEARHTSDVFMPNNYWCTTDSTTIETKIFDKLEDPEVGKVHFIPVKTSPVSNAGAGSGQVGK